MGTLLTEPPNQKNRQALTHTKRKPHAHRNGQYIRYIGTKNRIYPRFLSLF